MSNNIGKRIIKATIIDPLDENARGVTHYHGELEETLEAIKEKYDLPAKRRMRDMDDVLGGVF
jgi:hypothetical protein